MDNKYLFRVYHFDNNGNISSPFLSGHNGKFGTTEVADSVKDDVGNEFVFKGSLFNLAFQQHVGKRNAPT